MTIRTYIAGVGMTPFGKHLDKGLKALAGAAVGDALADAGITAGQMQAAFMGTGAAGVMTGQVCVPGQVVLRAMGIGRIPVVNVENACATSSTALHMACAAVAAGQYDIVLVCGYEKLYHEDRQRTMSVFTGAVDVETMTGAGAARSHSVFMDIYARWARQYMASAGATLEDFARVAEKNAFHGSLNPRAQFREAVTAEQVLAARVIAAPLTLPMCAPVGDGAAAAVVVSGAMRQRLGLRDAVRVDACVLASGWDRTGEDEPAMAAVIAAQAYRQAGIGPEDVNCVELHDAAVPAELMYYEYLGLCPPGGGARLLASGATRIGGRVPVNTSGGLTRKGHPIGATGASQVFELAEQLRGRAGARQVAGARVGLAENGGGFIGDDAASMVVTILSR